MRREEVRRRRPGRRRLGSSRALRELSRAISAERRVRFAYAYGSFLSRSDARDIDVAVSLSGGAVKAGGRASPLPSGKALAAGGAEAWAAVEEIAGRLEKALAYAYRLDVHALNGASAAFVFEVISKGRLLWERRREERLDWEAHVLSRYQDIKPMMDFHDRRYLSR